MPEEPESLKIFYKDREKEIKFVSDRRNYREHFVYLKENVFYLPRELLPKFACQKKLD